MLAPSPAVKLSLGLALLLLALFNLFFHITVQPVFIYDEARHVVSAVAMVRRHDYLVNYFADQPDYYNAKPPLSMWGAALGYRLLSNPFLGVRLFSLLAALSTGFLVFRYAARLAGFYAGTLATLLLFTIPILILRHGARTADPDMLFVCLTTAAMLAFSRVERRAIGLGYTLLGIAFLTKSFHAAPFLIAALVYSLYLIGRRRLDWRAALLLPLCFLLPVLPWAVARYAVDGTRFFHVMVYYDLLARTTHAVEAHFGTPLFYVNTVIIALGPALLVLAISLAAPGCRLQFRDARVILLLCWLLIPLTLYSLARSKLYWYLFPCLPPLVVLLAISPVNAINGGLHRIAGAVIALIMAANLALSEHDIATKILGISLHDEPAQETLVELSASTRPLQVKVYMDPDADLGAVADWYGTAQLLGNITLLRGGGDAFDSASGSNVYLLNDDGFLERR